MQYKTKRLEVGPMTEDHKQQILDLLTDETVGKTYMLPQYQNRQEAEPLFRRLVELSRDEKRYVAGIYLEGRFIGMLNETEIEGTAIEMGYALLPAFHGQGYATEAFAGAIEYLLKQNFTTVLAGAFSENIASIRVMEKCGMLRQSRTDTIDYRGKTHLCVYSAISK